MTRRIPPVQAVAMLAMLGILPDPPPRPVQPPREPVGPPPEPWPDIDRQPPPRAHLYCCQRFGLHGVHNPTCPSRPPPPRALTRDEIAAQVKRERRAARNAEVWGKEGQKR